METRDWLPWAAAGVAFGGVMYFFFGKAEAEEADVPGPTPGPDEPVIPGPGPKKKNGASGEAPTGQVDVSVLELQKIMLGLGWPTEKLDFDGDYGPQTTKAWAWITEKQQLVSTISRVNGKTARVNTHSYVALRSQWGNRAVNTMKPQDRAEYLFPIS
jgi:hypothetical protein